MIGIVLVSHSKTLALGIRELVLQMTGPDFPVAVAAGVGDDFADIGTDAVHVAEVLKPFCAADGALVLMDLGSAVLSAQMALDLLEAEDIPDFAEKIRLCSAPIVEAAVAAAVAANTGADLDTLLGEAMNCLAPKADQVGDNTQPMVTAVATAPTPEPPGLSFETEIRNPHGLHARPAATLVQTASRFQADTHLTNRTSGRGPASARSLTGIALLQVRCGDTVRFDIAGTDATATLAALQDLAADHFGEADLIGGPISQPQATPTPAADQTIPVSDGIAIGPACRLTVDLPDAARAPHGTPQQEQNKLNAALSRVQDEVAHLAKDDPTGIFAAQTLILSDPDLLQAVAKDITAGQSAMTAWKAETDKIADAYAAMDDAYLQARAADIRDIATRVVRTLAGHTAELRIAPEPPAILLVNELLPSEAAACDPHQVLGIIARTGSATAHAAIIARTLGIPMVIAAAQVDPSSLVGVTVAFDGHTGELHVTPSSDVVERLTEKRETLRRQHATVMAHKDEPAITCDGIAIEVLCNVGNATDARIGRDNGAEGVGLLRSEFAYLPFTATPTEDQQAEILFQVLAETGPGPVVIRTLDVGADKPLPFLQQKPEANPFLGVRGIRLSLGNPDVFATSLRAILRAGLDRDLWLMFPMIATPEEMAQARACVHAAHDALSAQGIAHCWPVQIGMMVEVPAAALLLDRFVPHADFFSIGTNDLTQYIMAAERGNAGLAALQDPAHPAVLRTIKMICDKAGERHVSVCGDAASDPVAAAALVATGVRSLSVRPNQVAAIKAKLRTLSVSHLIHELDSALCRDDAAAVRQIFSA